MELLQKLTCVHSDRERATICRGRRTRGVLTWWWPTWCWARSSPALAPHSSSSCSTEPWSGTSTFPFDAKGCWRPPPQPSPSPGRPCFPSPWPMSSAMTAPRPSAAARTSAAVFGYGIEPVRLNWFVVKQHHLNFETNFRTLRCQHHRSWKKSLVHCLFSI